MDAKIKLRLSWIKLYKQLEHAGKVCEHYGISRFTLRKWYKRYEVLGKNGLCDISSKPKNFPFQKRSEVDENLILKLRKERNLGSRRIHSELKRLYGISFSTATCSGLLSKCQWLAFIGNKRLKLTDFKNTVWLNLIDHAKFLAHIN